jgi:hypothetical protein
VIESLRRKGGRDVREMSGMAEDMEFALPRELRVWLRNSA